MAHKRNGGRAGPQVERQREQFHAATANVVEQARRISDQPAIQELKRSLEKWRGNPIAKKLGDASQKLTAFRELSPEGAAPRGRGQVEGGRSKARLPKPARKRRAQASPQLDRVLAACKRLEPAEVLRERTPGEIKAMLRVHFEKKENKVQGLGTPSRQVMDKAVRRFLAE